MDLLAVRQHLAGAALSAVELDAAVDDGIQTDAQHARSVLLVSNLRNHIAYASEALTAEHENAVEPPTSPIPTNLTLAVRNLAARGIEVPAALVQLRSKMFLEDSELEDPGEKAWERLLERHLPAWLSMEADFRATCELRRPWTVSR